VSETPPEEPYRLKLSPSAARDVHEVLPESVACSAVEFMDGPLKTNPHRVGKPLRNDLAGLHGARLGDYRIVYRINETQRRVEVVRIKHRADVYHP
jgi:mRNA interferase RelE/StbE